jgi:hypothetical protein
MKPIFESAVCLYRTNRWMTVALFIHNRANQWGLIIVDIEAAHISDKSAGPMSESRDFSLRKIARSFIRERAEQRNRNA